MLVLSRRTGESIVVNHGEITIAVLGITRNRVRIGVTAPPKVPVQRMEVHRRVQPLGERKSSPHDGIADCP
jgi:carbon storage regulator CsrA